MLNISAASAILLADKALAGITTASDEVIAAAGEVRKAAVESQEWLAEHETALLGHLDRLNVAAASVPVIAGTLVAAPVPESSAAPQAQTQTETVAVKEAVAGGAPETGNGTAAG